MRRFIRCFSVLAVVLALAVSCSKNNEGSSLPVVGNADLNGQKMELRYSVLGKLNIPSMSFVSPPPIYALILAGGMNEQQELTQEPFLFSYIPTLPEAGSRISFDLIDDDISLRCILRNKEYKSLPIDGGLPIVSGTLCLQRSLDDVFYLEFEIRTGDGNHLSGTANLNYIP